MRKALLPALILGTTALALSSCTVSVRPNLGLQSGGSNLIASLRPDKGEGRTYHVGEAVQIQLTTRDAGYVSLFALNANGTVTPMIRNAYVTKGTTVFPRAQDGVTFNVDLPEGIQRIRAIFTRVRPTTELVLGGVYDNGRWNTVTTEYLAPYAVADRDVQETYLYISR